MDASQIFTGPRRERVRQTGYEFQRATLDDCRQLLQEDLLRECDWKTLKQYTPDFTKAAPMLYSMCDAVFVLRSLKTGVRIALLCVGPKWPLGDRQITSIALVSTLMVDSVAKQFPLEFLRATKDALKTIHEQFGPLGNTLRKEDYKTFGKYLLACGVNMFKQETNKDVLVWLYEGPGQKRPVPAGPSVSPLRRRRRM